MKKGLAFTLGEILIALAVIGVVAALVIPQLVNGQKAGTARAQFDTAYSLLAKTIADMDADDVAVLPANYTINQSFYPKIKSYSRIAIDCGNQFSTKENTSVCVGYGSKDTSGNTDNYKIFNKKSNTKIALNRLDDGGFVLTNGMMVAIENPEGTNTVNGVKVPNMVLITVDINGKNRNPNRWGWDLFTFELTKNGLLPLGAENTNATYSKNPKTYCSENSTNRENGMTCAYYAVTNQDYFKELYQGH